MTYDITSKVSTWPENPNLFEHPWDILEKLTATAAVKPGRFDLQLNSSVSKVEQHVCISNAGYNISKAGKKGCKFTMKTSH